MHLLQNIGSKHFGYNIWLLKGAPGSLSFSIFSYFTSKMSHFSGLWLSSSSEAHLSPPVSSSICVWLGSVTSWVCAGLRRYWSSSALMATLSGTSHLLKCSRALWEEGRLGGYIGRATSRHEQSRFPVLLSVKPFIHVATLEELRGLGIVEESVPALFLCLRQRSQHVPGCDVAGLTLEFLQAVLCKSYSELKEFFFNRVTLG